MSKWISFRERLPTFDDANEKGEIELCESDGRRRFGQWNWIAQNRSAEETEKLWHANGFTAWRRTK